MKLASILGLLLLATARPAPVAIVYSLTGTATLASPTRPLHRLDRLQAGAIVEVGPASRLAFAFASGARYELGEGARVTLGKIELAAHAGLVKALPRVPPFPILTAIAKSEKPGAKAGGPRIRGEEIDCLSPRDGAATLADATVLRFQPAAGASRHEVVVEDKRGNVVFQAVTESSAVAVPPGKLAAGACYHWTVKTLDRPGPGSPSGEADFVTLSRKAAADRERVRKAVESEDGGRELLEAVDRALGLAVPCCAATSQNLL